MLFFIHHVMNTGQSPFFSGFTLPIHGIDHILAIIVAGIWTSLLKPSYMKNVLGIFVILLFCGSLLGIYNPSIPLFESGILLSLLALSILIFFMLEFSWKKMAFILGIFSFCHGYPFGADLPGGWKSLSLASFYIIGYLLGTICLFSFGYLLGKGLITFSFGKKLVKAMGVLLFLFFVYTFYSSAFIS